MIIDDQQIAWCKAVLAQQLSRRELDVFARVMIKRHKDKKLQEGGSHDVFGHSRA